jgi:hypothetical protein
MPAENGLIPSPFASANVVLSRFNDAGFCPDEVVALLASSVCPFLNGHPPHGSSYSHSLAMSSILKPHAQFDCTPRVFDTRFFAEIQDHKKCSIPERSKIRIPSDVELSQGSCLPILLAKQLVLTYVD